MQDPLEATIDRASRGDGTAIDQLLERNLPRLRAFVRLRMGPKLRAREGSCDLVQSACREVLERLDRYRYRGEAEFRRWLFATALRKVRDRADYHQAKKRDVGREVALQADSAGDSLAAVYADFTTPSRVVDVRERVRRFEAAFDQLSDEHREVITLARIIGLSHREVATAMGRSEPASRMLLFRALARLSLLVEH